MQKTVREWVGLIADPEKKEMVMGWLSNYAYPSLAKEKYKSIESALFFTVNQHAPTMPEGEVCEYEYMLKNPPTLITTPTERQTAEALLKEYNDFLFKGEYALQYPIEQQAITDFLTSKYGKG